MKALVYGCGQYFQMKKDSVKDEIIGFIDSYKTGECEGIHVYLPEQISELEYDVIYVMARENLFCEMLYKLLELGVSREKIIIGQNLEPYIWGENLFLGEGKSFFIDENNKLCYRIQDMKLSFSTYDEFYGVRDVFCNRDYDFGMHGEKTVVCDIGANIGAAAIYFASREDVVKVYSYEPFEPTYNLAVYNVQKNKTLENKIVLKNAGMSSYCHDTDIMYNPSMTCGLSTSVEMSRNAKEQYQKWGLYKAESEVTTTVSLIDIAEELSEIIRMHSREKLIIKLDCEGEEYAIMERMQESGLLEYVAMIMMEWHYRGEQPIRNVLEENGFCLFSFTKGTDMGTIYAIKNRAEKG